MISDLNARRARTRRAALTVTLLSLILAPGVARSSPVFPAQRVFIGGSPGGLAIADLNDNGVLDLVTCDATANLLSVSLGVGNGTFAPRQTFATGGGPTTVLLTDLNGDGKLDAVTTNRADATVSVLIRNATGFAPKIDYATGSTPQSVAAGDVDRDGRPDLVTANYEASTISVLLQTPAGSFQPHVDFATGQLPSGVALGMFDADHNLDVAVSKNGYCGVLLGDGHGSFGPFTNYPANGRASAILDLDLNGDGKLDLVSGHDLDNSVSRLLGNGAGGFVYQLPATLAAEGCRSLQLIEPTEGFGRRILASGASSFAVLPLNPDGTFGARFVVDVGHQIGIARAGDMDGDGMLDIVATNPMDGTATVLFGDGTGTWSVSESAWNTSALSDPYAVDLDGDGYRDLVLRNRNYPYYVAIRRNNAGVLASAALYSVQTSSGGMAVADFNGDGRFDAALAEEGVRIKVLLGNSSGGFTGSVDTPCRHSDAELTTGDFNGDGRPDLLVGNQVLLGSGGGVFIPGATLAVGGKFATGRFDADADLDLAAVNTPSHRVEVMLGNGDGTFGPSITYPTGTDPVRVISTDLDQDGHVDLVTANRSGASVSVLWGLGDGTFAPKVDLPTELSSLAVGCADLDRDGLVDIVAPGARALMVMRGTSPRTFAPAERYEPAYAADRILDLLLVDLDKDLRPEAIITERFNAIGSMVVVPNISRGNVSTPGPPPSSLAIAPATNPIRVGAEIALGLPAPSRLRLEVFDLAGRRVATLLDGQGEVRSIARWSGRSHSGASLPAGAYTLRLSAGGAVATRKIVWLGH